MEKLKSKKDIENVFRLGKYGCMGFLCLKFSKNDLKYSRIAMSIGLKYSKKSTQRNSAKRIIREAAAKYYEKIKPGYDLVFYLKNAKIQEVDFKNACDLMKNILTKSNLFNIKPKTKNEKHKTTV
jgi:ribonuclease P protein component